MHYYCVTEGEYSDQSEYWFMSERKLTEAELREALAAAGKAALDSPIKEHLSYDGERMVLWYLRDDISEYLEHPAFVEKLKELGLEQITSTTSTWFAGYYRSAKSFGCLAGHKDEDEYEDDGGDDY